jgi:hypothetical protein
VVISDWLSTIFVAARCASRRLRLLADLVRCADRVARLGLRYGLAVIGDEAHAREVARVGRFLTPGALIGCDARGSAQPVRPAHLVVGLNAGLRRFDPCRATSSPRYLGPSRSGGSSRDNALIVPRESAHLISEAGASHSLVVKRGCRWVGESFGDCGSVPPRVTVNDVLVDLAVKSRPLRSEGDSVQAEYPPLVPRRPLGIHQNCQVAGSSTTQPSVRYGSRGVAQRRTSGLMKVTMYTPGWRAFVPVGCVRLVDGRTVPDPRWPISSSRSSSSRGRSGRPGPWGARRTCATSGPDPPPYSSRPTTRSPTSLRGKAEARMVAYRPPDAPST